jgi:hypothetical protein
MATIRSVSRPSVDAKPPPGARQGRVAEGTRSGRLSGMGRVRLTADGVSPRPVPPQAIWRQRAGAPAGTECRSCDGAPDGASPVGRMTLPPEAADAPGAQLSAVDVVVVAAVGEQLPWLAARIGGTASSSGMSWVMSLRLPPVRLTASGMPPASQIGWCLEPGRPRSTRHGTTWSPFERGCGSRRPQVTPEQPTRFVGSWFQVIPVLSTNTMPARAARASIGRRPGWR